MKTNTVWWFNGSEIRRCVSVCLEWVERYSDGTSADTPEPAVFFPDGTCAALWLCDYTLNDVFKDDN